MTAIIRVKGKLSTINMEAKELLSSLKNEDVPNFIGTPSDLLDDEGQMDGEWEIVADKQGNLSYYQLSN